MSEQQNALSGGQDNTGTGGGQQAAATGEGQEQQQQQAGGESQQQAKAEGEQSKAEGEQQAKAEGAPEKYEDFKAPEGVTLDAEVLGEFTEYARELGLNQEKAQKAVDMAAKLMQKAQNAHVEAYKAQQGEWVKSLQTDPEIGGAKFLETQAAANKALDTFGDAELVDYLKATGLSNFPPLFKAFHKIGKLLAEDKFVTGGAATQQQADPARRMYPNSNLN